MNVWQRIINVLFTLFVYLSFGSFLFNCGPLWTVLFTPDIIPVTTSHISVSVPVQTFLIGWHKAFRKNDWELSIKQNSGYLLYFVLIYSVFVMFHNVWSYCFIKLKWTPWTHLCRVKYKNRVQTRETTTVCAQAVFKILYTIACFSFLMCWWTPIHSMAAYYKSITFSCMWRFITLMKHQQCLLEYCRNLFRSLYKSITFLYTGLQAVHLVM